MNRTLLFLGASNVSHPGQGQSTAALLARELQELRPGAWQVQGAPISKGRRMAAEAEDLVREYEPDFVLLGLTAEPSVYESVLVKVRRRWPYAAAAAAWIEAFVARLSGHETGPEEGDRGRLYAIAKGAALALIGGETRMTVDQSLENSGACLAALAALESVPVLVRLPVGGVRATRARRRRYEERLGRLKAGIIEGCSAYRIPFVDVGGALQAAGRAPGHGRDVVHLDLETRRFEARLLARQILALVGSEQAADAPSGALSV